MCVGYVRSHSMVPPPDTSAHSNPSRHYFQAFAQAPRGQLPCSLGSVQARLPPSGSCSTLCVLVLRAVHSASTSGSRIIIAVRSAGLSALLPLTSRLSTDLPQTRVGVCSSALLSSCATMRGVLIGSMCVERTRSEPRWKLNSKERPLQFGS